MRGYVLWSLHLMFIIYGRTDLVALSLYLHFQGLGYGASSIFVIIMIAYNDHSQAFISHYLMLIVLSYIIHRII